VTTTILDMPTPTYNYLPLQQFAKNTTYTVQNAGDECGHGHYGNVVPLVKKETSYRPSIYGASANSLYRNVENTSNMHENGRLGMLDKNPSYWVPAHRDPFGKVEIANIEKLAFTYCQLERNAYDETIPSTPHMLLETKPSVMAEFEFSQLERRACTTVCILTCIECEQQFSIIKDLSFNSLELKCWSNFYYLHTFSPWHLDFNLMH
jgi:hypothetical protein